jgi:hypothetical protein
MTETRKQSQESGPEPVSERLEQRPHQDRSAIGDVGGQVGHTLEGLVIRTPGRGELAWDAVLAAAAIFEAVSPPAAVAGVVVNRLIHAGR